ncbi:MAG TPA: HAD hydrolase-like protein [Terracidiphilus sp.]|nr:HAD hydrolase-like protein [Terracidiphilus sp.]
MGLNSTTLDSPAWGSTALIFDLDGTLTDSKPGILGCLRKVIEERGMSDGGPLDRFIGPPVEEWVRELMPGGTDEEHAALARDYRACYDREGWSNNSVFPGVSEMLAALHAAGFPLYVCTSKHRHFAIRILEAFELAQFFAGIYGDKLEYASHTKADLLARVLSEQAIDCGKAWMIGDRSFDIEAAHANELRCIAAGWGYGSAEEWAGADAIALTPQGIPDLVTREQAIRN